MSSTSHPGATAPDTTDSSRAEAPPAGGAAGAPPGAGGPPKSASKVGDFYIAQRLTDAGNAELFAAWHAKKVRWVPGWGSWVRYDGTRWSKCSESELVPLAIDVARQFYAVAANEPDDDKRKALAAHAKATEAAGRLEAMVRLARGMAIEQAERFDADPMLLNVANGTLDLQSATFRPHAREDLLTKITRAAYDPRATAPTWVAFVERILPDADVRAWVQRLAGYALTGSVGEQVLAFFHGKGANGKSTYLETLQHVLGDFAQPGAPDLLLAKRGESHPTELADLQGARLVICQETEAGRQWAESLVKRLTGGDTIKARWMRCDFFSFAPTHKLIVSANHKPKVRGQDKGIWRRIKLIPFDVTIPEAEQDKALAAKLQAEASGILNWMLDGLRTWRERGLGDVEAIVKATNAYRTDQDVLTHFVEDECALGADAFVPHEDLYRVYTAWCIRVGETAWQRNTFLDGLEERDLCRRGKGAKGKRGMRGVKLKGGAGGAT